MTPAARPADTAAAGALRPAHGAPRSRGLCVRLATSADDAALRQLLRRSVIPGAVRVAFTREPAYAAGSGIAGAADATVIAERDGQLTAMGRCSVHTLHRNGLPRRVAYLGELRFDPAAPTSVRGMREGYAVLAEAAARAGAEGCFTSISEDNVRARRILENGGRLGLPAYRPFCRLVTLLAPVKARAARDHGNDSAVGGTIDPAALSAFLEHHSRSAQLTLTWDDARWRALAAHGISPHDFVVIRRSGRIVGAAGVWDQRAFKQTVIDGYAGVLRYTRPLANAALALGARPPLPAPGAVFAQGALLALGADDPRDWPALWRAAEARAAARGLSWLTLALDDRDPACAPLRRLMRARVYRTSLYDVTWPDRPTWPDAWDERPVRPEVGLL